MTYAEVLSSEYTSVPGTVTPEWAAAFGSALEQTTWRGSGALKSLISYTFIFQLLQKAAVLLKTESTLVEILPQEEAEVVVVGDTHGQVHDILEMFKTAGFPTEKRFYILNGNHETTTCTTMYGFKGELDQKYGKAEGQIVYKACKRLFATLPLAALVNNATLVLHGGLFRKPTAALPSRNKRKKRYAATKCELGSLEDLRASGKGGLDPNGRGSTVVATDVLWSDPVGAEGLHLNTSRGVGVVFGPDVTQTFLVDNGLKLILRSHEGPDARYEREDMASMQEGWTLDHKTPAGKLLTIFSAPDYPQFQAEDETRFCNLAAVAVLKSPGWCEPEMVQYEAVLPRPPAQAFYDYLSVPCSDDEISIAGSEGSQASLASVTEDMMDTAQQRDAPEAEAHPDPHGGAGHPQTSVPCSPNGMSHAFAEPLESSALSQIPAVEDPSQRRSSKRQRDKRAGQAAENAASIIPQQPSQSAPLQEVPVSQSKAAALISISAEALEPLPPTSIQGQTGPTDQASRPTHAINHEARTTQDSIAPEPAQALAEGGSAAREGDLSGPHSVPTAAAEGPENGQASQDVDMLTPSAQIIQQPPHPGRELEQAAAHTLAVAGGVAQDTPETGTLHESPMMGPPTSPPAAPMHPIASQTESQSNALGALQMTEPQGQSQGIILPESQALQLAQDPMQGIEALPDATSLSNGQSNEQLGMQNKARQPTRVSKRSKTPAPWR